MKIQQEENHTFSPQTGLSTAPPGARLSKQAQSLLRDHPHRQLCQHQVDLFEDPLRRINREYYSCHYRIKVISGLKYFLCPIYSLLFAKLLF